MTVVIMVWVGITMLALSIIAVAKAGNNGLLASPESAVLCSLYDACNGDADMPDTIEGMLCRY